MPFPPKRGSTVVSVLSRWALPLFLLLILLCAVRHRTDGYSAFLEGAAESLRIICQILPPVVGLMIGIAMLRASGLLSLLARLLAPVTGWLGMPAELLPLALLRPISGSGGTAILADLLKAYGADSLVGNMASVMAGSTETTFYTLAVYFGAVRISDSRYALKAALIADAAGILASVFVSRLFFS